MEQELNPSEEINDGIQNSESFESQTENVVSQLSDVIHGQMGKVVIGQEDLIDMLLVGFLSGGHILLEGVPGIAKTLSAKLLAKCVNTDFSRIQFTPDLMPSDVTGTSMFNMKTSEFTFNEGPIFSNLVLIDEINRSPAKTQAALFEVMEEGQVTIDGNTHKMEFPFLVIATQNPIEQEGTYKLPEAQLDRFIMKLNLDYPSLTQEKEILMRFENDFSMSLINEVKPVCTTEQLKAAMQYVEKVHIQEALLGYIAELVHNTRIHPDFYLGASPRASLSIMKTSKAFAALQGRNFVTPDDIKQMAYPVLNHRVILTPEREMEGITTKEMLESIIDSIEIPR